MRRATILSVAAAAAVSVMLGSNRSARAATENDWTNTAADSSWNTAGNWSLGHAPTATETATFPASFSTFNTISIDANQTLYSITHAAAGPITLTNTTAAPTATLNLLSTDTATDPNPAINITTTTANAFFTINSS